MSDSSIPGLLTLSVYMPLLILVNGKITISQLLVGYLGLLLLGGASIAGEDGLLDAAVPRFEQVMIETALNASGGRRQDAARLLGWGRNTLTRKIKEHGLQFDD